MSFCIGVSTINVDDLLISRLETYSTLLPQVDFLVVSQRECRNETVQYSKSIRVIYSKTSGLSISRNILIDNCDSKWLWIQDDDIVLNIEDVKTLIYSLSQVNDTLNFVKVKSLENTEEYFKNYAFHNWKLTCFNFLKVSSIELVLPLNLIKSNRLYFDESLGLGTHLPSCEENDFIYRCMLANIKTQYIDVAPSLHTTLHDTRNIDYLGRYRARGYLCAKLPLGYRIVCFIRWMIKLDKNVGLRVAVQQFFSGYKYYSFQRGR